MAITTFDGYLGAARQRLQLFKIPSGSGVSGAWFTLFNGSGQPGAGSLAIGNTANGLVPTDTVAGFPLINAFAGGATGYVGVIDFASSVACRLMLYDRLFHAGTYSFNSAVTLATQPAYTSRIPEATNYNTELWVETVTAFTGNLTIAVTYTNQSGTAARTTGTFASGIAPTVGRMIQLPLQAGDSGIQKVESVTSTVATVGTFNIVVARPIWSGRVKMINDGEIHGLDRVGMPIIYDTSALALMVAPDSTSFGQPEMSIQIVNG